MIAFACVVAAAVLVQAPGQSRLRVAGPQPAVVVFPESSQVTLRVDVSSADELRRMTSPKVPAVDGLRLQLSQPNTSQRSHFDGRRMTESFSIAWTLEITPARVGEFTIPSFDVPVGNGSERTPPLTLRVVKDIEGDKFAYFKIGVEPRRVYVHEPIRLRFDLGVEQSLQVAEDQAQNGERYMLIEVAAPWLTDLDGTVPIETPPADRRRLMNLVYNDGKNRTLLQTEFADQAQHQGRRANGFCFERGFLPVRPGKLAIPATAMGFEVYTGETRVVQDFVFARREAVRKTYYVYAPATEVDVVPLPEVGKPTPFYGAVGRFKIDARLDKDRVKVGSSVKLIVSIRGEGNIEFLQVPELPADLAGFHLLGNKEKRERGLVEATYDLTPLDAKVHSVPAVTWNYFDTTPGVERYQVVTTAALPLRVEALPDGEGLVALPGDEAKVMVPGKDDIFDMKPLGEGEPVPASSPAPRSTSALWLLAPWLVALCGAWLQRTRARARADVAGQRERGAKRAFARALGEGKSPFDALVAYLADRLAVAEAAIIAPDLGERLRGVGIEPDLAQRVVGTVEAGVAARYGGSGGVARADAEQLVDALERVRLTRVVAPVAVALLLACLASGARAQANDSARGEAAYRAGDYATAAQAFAALAAQPGADRRAYYNLGNALFRQGELARALAAYEKARLGMPRDPQLAANLALVRSKLELGSAEGEPFVQALASLRDALTLRERVWLGVGLHALAAVLLVFGGRRTVPRVLGALVLLPALLLAVELLWLQPARAPLGIVVAARGEVSAEPREGLEAVVKLRRGASVEVLGEGPSWTKVRAGAREGYLPAAAVEVVR